MLPDGAEHEAADWQVAMEALLLVGERDAPIKMAQIAVMKALKRHNPLSLGSAALLIPLRPCRRLGLLQRLLAGED